MTAAYLEPVTDYTTARAFLEALHAAGMLYHPEESAAECLRLHRLDADTLETISANMAATFDHLTDPCARCIAIMGTAETVAAVVADPEAACDLLEDAEMYLDKWAGGSPSGTVLRDKIGMFLRP